MTRWRGLIVACAGVVVAATLGTATPEAGASSYTETFVTMVSQRADFVGQGDSRYFHPGNAIVGAGWSGDTVFVNVRGGNLGDESFSFEFAAPDDQRLKVGEYDRAQRSPFQELGRPGISISGESRGCNEVSGRFIVKDIALEPRHKVGRLWIVYEHSCEGSSPPMIGEVRYRMPGDGGGLMVGPHAVRSPRVPVGGIVPVVPVRAVNTSTSPVSIGSVTIEGSTDHRIRFDECSSRTLQSNESCAVWVRFTPSAEGTPTARVRITESGGTQHTAELQGDVRGSDGISPTPGQPGGTVGGGSTVFSFDSERGDYIGQGEQRSWDPSNAEIYAVGNHHGVSGTIYGDDGENWTADFYPPAGDILAPGLTYPDAGRAAFSPGAAGLDVSGDGRGCNTLEGTFTVHAIRTDEFGNLREFSASFEQHCEGLDPALRGIFRYVHPGPFPALEPYPPPEPEPEVQTFERTISLVIRDRTARGTVRMAETVIRCRAGVTVKIQRKRVGRFRTIATVTTDDAARYEHPVGRRLGVYRAVAPRRVLADGNICARAVSASWRY